MLKINIVHIIKPPGASQEITAGVILQTPLKYNITN